MDQIRDAVDLSLAEILASLSYALDLANGQSMGHAQKTCLIGMKIASQLGLSQDDTSSLYHALLLKDSGCSSNAARMFEIFGSDELVAKRASKVVDWSNLLEAARYAAAHVLPDGSLLARARRMLRIAVDPAGTTEAFMEARCNRGAEIALSIGLGESAAACIRTLDEHWDGHGAPYHLKGDTIPLLGRIACLAQTLEVFVTTFGLTEGYDVIHKRSGKWFDPELVKIADTMRHEENFWRMVQTNPRDMLLTLDMRATLEVAKEDRIDSICDAFAQIVDAKASFTAAHSSRVCDYAVMIGEALDITGRRLTTLRRAALLHDIGKLTVSNAILEKPGKLDADEWIVMRKHPYYTQQILGQISGFHRLTEIASAHHERLDGKGYFMGLSASDLDLEMRILAVADVYDALSAKRPYRDALCHKDVFAIMDRDSGIALDAECVNAIKEMTCDHTMSSLQISQFSIAKAA